MHILLLRWCLPNKLVYRYDIFVFDFTDFLMAGRQQEMLNKLYHSEDNN